MRIEQLAEGVTLYLGDCRDIIPSLRGYTIISDPPYGVSARAGMGGGGDKGDGGMWAGTSISAAAKAIPAMVLPCNRKWRIGPIGPELSKRELREMLAVAAANTAALQ